MLTRPLSSDLWIGTTFAIFSISETTPILRDTLKMRIKGLTIALNVALIIDEEMPSLPVLEVFLKY